MGSFNYAGTGIPLFLLFYGNITDLTRSLQGLQEHREDSGAREENGNDTLGFFRSRMASLSFRSSFFVSYLTLS